MANGCVKRCSASLPSREMQPKPPGDLASHLLEKLLLKGTDVPDEHGNPRAPRWGCEAAQPPWETVVCLRKSEVAPPCGPAVRPCSPKFTAA